MKSNEIDKKTMRVLEDIREGRCKVLKMLEIGDQIYFFVMYESGLETPQSLELLKTIADDIFEIRKKLSVDV